MSIVIRRIVLLAQVALSGVCVTLPPVYRAHYDIRLVEDRARLRLRLYRECGI